MKHPRSQGGKLNRDIGAPVDIWGIRVGLLVVTSVGAAIPVKYNILLNFRSPLILFPC